MVIRSTDNMFCFLMTNFVNNNELGVSTEFELITKGTFWLKKPKLKKNFKRLFQKFLSWKHLFICDSFLVFCFFLRESPCIY
jgi:hypothetical protein